MRIIVGLVQHESNSFNPTLTNITDFNFLVGENIFKNPDAYMNSSLEGMINIFKKNNVEIIPAVLARPTSEGGLVTTETYEEIKDKLLAEIQKVRGSVDGVCFALHGSMTVEKIGDAEGDLIRSIRTVMGDKIPIVCSLDMHAIVTEKMLKNADAFVSYRTAPHVDKVETGEKAAKILYEVLTDDHCLYTAAVKLPILISGEKSESDKFPMQELFNEIKKSDQNTDVLASSYCLGFLWVDVEFNTGSVIVVTRNNYNLAKNEAHRLAKKFINRLSDFGFTTETHSFENAIKIANNETVGPIFVIDSGDNPGAGGSQDITCTLEYLLTLKTDKILYAVIADKSAYQECVAAGLNNEVFIRLGKKDENIGARPLEFKCKVKNLSRYKDIRIAVITVNNIEIVITTQKIVLTEPEFFKKAGIDFDYKIVVLKSGYLDPKLKPYAKRVLLGLSPGYTNQILEELDYKKINRPIYPFDDISEIELKYI